MTTSFVRRLAAASIAPIVCGFLAACGGTTVGTEPGGPKPGTPPNDGGVAMCAAGEHKKLDCNDCTCVEGEWACTRNLCPQPNCKEGEQRGKGCGACTCTNGEWQCPLILCPVCSEGSTKQSDDGCNTCTCTDGQWACTQKACPPKPVCKEGDTTYDGCNGCTCTGGQWACTNRYCPPSKDGGAAARGCGGWLGNTCTASEYCAYMPGQYCGAADASSTCKPRPTACDDNYAPVCGCDGKTYSNSCDAAAKGTGVMSTGPCTLP